MSMRETAILLMSFLLEVTVRPVWWLSIYRLIDKDLSDCLLS